MNNLSSALFDIKRTVARARQRVRDLLAANPPQADFDALLLLAKQFSALENGLEEWAASDGGMAEVHAKKERLLMECLSSQSFTAPAPLKP